MTPFHDKKTSRRSRAQHYSVAGMPCLWPVIHAIPAILPSSVWDEHETSFDRCGQARVFLVHVVIRSETKHALLTDVLSDVDELYREHEKYLAKAW